MILLRTLSILSLLLAFTGLSEAQLATSLRLDKKLYLTGEPVVASVTITNHSGRELTFYGDGRISWLNFNLKNGRGEEVGIRATANFGRMTIKAGESLVRQVDLTQLFLLDDSGNYSASAVVRMPGSSDEGATTSRVTFLQSPGSVYWRQKVGVGGGSNRTREYRIINFGGEQKSLVYVQVTDGRTGRNVRTFPLGELLVLRKPLVTVDRNQQLHVLYLATPSMWVHCQVDTDGKLVHREIHQRAATGDPQLLTFGDGTVRVANSITYDPKAAAEAKAKVRKATDRPPGTF